jgi:SprT protein
MTKVEVPSIEKARVMSQLKDGIAVCEKHYGITVKTPKVFFDLRGTTAGTANYRDWVIRLNPAIMMANLSEFRQTVLHELAHLVNDIVHPEAHRPTTSSYSARRVKRDPHGAGWAEVMGVLGLEPRRCHSYDISAAVKGYKYTCTGCSLTVTLTQHKHDRMLANPQTYRHSKCKHSSLVYTTTPAPVAAPVVVAAPVAAAPVAPVAPAAFAPETSKWGKCLLLFVANKFSKNRREMIELFVREAGCTPAGASTYYSKCVSR